MKPEDKERIIERIKKLLEVTEARGATPDEAASAAKFVELNLRKYQLDMKEIILEDLKKGGIGEMWARGTKNKPNMSGHTKLPMWSAVLAPAVAKLFEVFARQGNWPEVGWVVIFVGYTLDIEVAKWTYEYLMREIHRYCDELESRMEEQLHSQDEDERSDALSFMATSKKLRRQSFRLGMTRELVTRLEQAVAAKQKEAVDVRDTADGKGTALIVVSKSEALARYLGFDPEKGYKETTASGKVHIDSYEAGKAAGRKVNLQPNPIDFRDNRTDQKRLKGGEL